jgi:phosphatidylglycerophosphatase A
MGRAVQRGIEMSGFENRAAVSGFLIRLLSTFFFSGYLPRAPGTWASGFTAVILFFAWPHFWIYQLVLIAGVFVLGARISGKAEAFYGHDGRPIVIDEVAGQMVALFMVPQKFLPFFLGFVFFRIFDIIKPPPAKQWESYRRGWGVMADDLAAGFYAACLLQIALAILGKWGINFL